MKTAMTEVASSGEEEPAAMRVAPATSGVRQSASDTRVSEGTKKSSQTTVSPDIIFTIKLHVGLEIVKCNVHRNHKEHRNIPIFRY